MKKIFAVFMLMFCFIAFSGCSQVSGFIKSNAAASSAVSASVSGGIVAAVQNNPKIKADVIQYLGLLKEYLTCTECSMDELLLTINSKFPAKYRAYGAILADVVADNYTLTSEKISAEDKALLVKQIDRTLKYLDLIEG
jgi:hypothetical protein